MMDMLQVNSYQTTSLQVKHSGGLSAGSPLAVWLFGEQGPSPLTSRMQMLRVALLKLESRNPNRPLPDHLDYTVLEGAYAHLRTSHRICWIHRTRFQSQKRHPGYCNYHLSYPRGPG